MLFANARYKTDTVASGLWPVSLAIGEEHQMNRRSAGPWLQPEVRENQPTRTTQAIARINKITGGVFLAATAEAASATRFV